MTPGTNWEKKAAHGNGSVFSVQVFFYIRQKEKKNDEIVTYHIFLLLKCVSEVHIL